MPSIALKQQVRVQLIVPYKAAENSELTAAKQHQMSQQIQDLMTIQSSNFRMQNRRRKEVLKAVLWKKSSRYSSRMNFDYNNSKQTIVEGKKACKKFGKQNCRQSWTTTGQLTSQLLDLATATLANSRSRTLIKSITRPHLGTCSLRSQINQSNSISKEENPFFNGNIRIRQNNWERKRNRRRSKSSSVEKL